MDKCRYTLWKFLGKKFVASVNAYERVTSKLIYQLVGHHVKKEVRTALPKLASFLALTSSELQMSMV